MNIHGIGTDIVECLRIAQLIERHADRFINRVYTKSEVQFCNQSKSSTQLFAERWAAKEAVLKAIGIGLIKGLNFRDVEIRPNPEGKLIVAMQGVAKELFETSGVADVLITTAHCRTHATAYAIAVSKEQDLF